MLQRLQDTRGKICMIDRIKEAFENAKVLNRELMRLETSLKAAGEKPILCFLHYPPLYQGYECPEILKLLDRYNVERCCYGHLHL